MLALSCMKQLLAFLPCTCFLWYIPQLDVSFSWPHYSVSKQSFSKDIIPPNLFAFIFVQIDKHPFSIQKYFFLILLTLCYYTLSHSTTSVSQVKKLFLPIFDRLRNTPLLCDLNFITIYYLSCDIFTSENTQDE